MNRFLNFIKKEYLVILLAIAVMALTASLTSGFDIFKSEKEKLTTNIEKSVTQKVKENPVFANVDSVVVLSIDTITQKKDLELRFWTIEKEISLRKDSIS